MEKAEQFADWDMWDKGLDYMAPEADLLGQVLTGKADPSVLDGTPWHFDKESGLSRPWTGSEADALLALLARSAQRDSGKTE